MTFEVKLLSSKKKRNFFSFIICLTEKKPETEIQREFKNIVEEEEEVWKRQRLGAYKGNKYNKKIDFRADNDVEDSDWWRNQRIFDPLTKCWRAFLEIV